MSVESDNPLDIFPKTKPLTVAAVTAVIYVLVAIPALAHGQATSSASWTALSLSLASMLVALSTIDADSYILPDRLTLPLTAVGILAHIQIGGGHMLQSLGAATVAFGLMAGISCAYAAVRGRPGLGLGDAKLMAAAGAWLGLSSLPTVVALASVAALGTVTVAALRQGRVALGARLPFGPFIALAIWLVWLHGPLA